MSWMVAPIMFKGYHNGDAGTVYPNSPSMLNCRINDRQSVEQMNGYAKYQTQLSALSGSGSIIGMYEGNYTGVDGYNYQTKIYMKQTATSGPASWSIKAYKDNNGNWTDMGQVVGALGVIGNASFKFSTFIKKCIATYSAPLYGNNLYYADVNLSAGGGFSELSVCPLDPSMNEVHYNRLFVCGDNTNKSTINWSDIDTINTWPSTATLNVNTDDGDYITGIKSFKGDLYVFKTRSLYKIIGDNFNPATGNYAVVRLEGLPGNVCPSSICTANGNMYWVTQKNIVEFNGSSFKYIDYPYLRVDRDGLSYSSTTEWDPFILQHNETNNEIIFTQRGTSTWYAYNYLVGEWSRVSISDTTMKFTAMLEHAEPTTGIKSLVFGTDSGDTFQFDTSRAFINSVGTSIGINSYYETDWTDLGTVMRKDGTKIILNTKQDGILSAHSYALSCSTYYDYDTVARSMQVVYCEGATNQYHEIYPDVQTFRRIKLKFANNVIDTRFQLNNAFVEFNRIDESGRI